MTARQTNIVSVDFEIARYRSATGVGLDLPADLSFERWSQIGVALGRSYSRDQWEIGDWWAHGEHRYGERAALVREGELGYSFHTCANLASVARRFECSRRREHVSFAHHAEVAGLDAAEADSLLDWCSNLPDGRRRTLQELRDEKHERRMQARWRDKEYMEQRSKPVEAGPKTVHITTTRLEPQRTVAHITTWEEPQPPPTVWRPSAPAFNQVAVARAALDALTEEQELDLIAERWAPRGYRLVK